MKKSLGASPFIGHHDWPNKNIFNSNRLKLVKYAVMQIEKQLINDRLRVSNVSSKFRIPTIYNFVVIYP